MFSRRSREFKSGDRISGRLSGSGFSTGSDSSDMKLDEGTIRAVEDSLRDALTLNNEEARALLGRIEYQKDNFQAAVHILDGIQVDGIFPRVKTLPPPKTKHKRGKPPAEAPAITLNGSILMLEAVYLKVKALEHLGRSPEATHACNVLMESFDAAFPRGLPDHLKGTKLQEFLNNVLEFLPEFYKREALYEDAIRAYRRAIVGFGEPQPRSLRKLQVGLAVLLLYGGVTAPTCPQGIYQGGFVPCNNVEEAIVLLMNTLSSTTERSLWDPEVMEHLCFALATCGHFKALAEQYESLLPGLSSRTDRWYDLALCYTAGGEKKVALNLLKKILSNVEKPRDVFSLLHAASICSENPQLASEGADYSRKAVEYAEGAMGYLKGRAWQVLGLLLSMKARTASSNAGRTQTLKEALYALHEAAKLEKKDADVVFHLGLVNAEQGNLKVALDSAKTFLKLKGPSLRGWRFLALVLSAQQRYEEAEMVIDAALQETSKWERGELLLIKAKLQVARQKHTQALETYKLLLTQVQSSVNQGRVSELTVLHEMAALLTSLSRFNDAERCLEKAKLRDSACAATWYEYGSFYSAQKRNAEALSAYNTALTCDTEHVNSKVGIGSLLYRSGSGSFPVARSFLNDALRSQPKSPSAWFHLGVLHETEGRLEQAADCFRTAYLLDQAAPVEDFTTLLET